jgi:hypothetical protein
VPNLKQFEKGNWQRLKVSSACEEGIMKTKLLLMLFVALFCVSASSIVIPFVAAAGGWSKIYVGEYGNFWPNKMISTSDGGFALAGLTHSSGNVSADFWFVKTDSAGNQQWNRTYGGAGDDEANGLIQTNDGGYALVGITTSFNETTGYPDAWLVKTDAYGNQTWDATYGGLGDDEANAVIQTLDGGYAIAGFTQSVGNGSITFGWLVKVDSFGKEEWNKVYAVGIDNDLYSLVQTNDEGYALAGYTNSTGSQDYWLVKTDSLGNPEWTQTYGGAGDDVALCLLKTTDGGFALVGTQTFHETRENKAWLVKADSDGTMQWNQTYPGQGNSYAISLIQTSDGGYALVGGTAVTFPSTYGVPFLVKTDPSGKIQWNQTYQQGYQANSLVQVSDGGYVIAGEWGYPNAPPDGWMTKTDENGVAPTTPAPSASPLASTSPAPTSLLQKSSTAFATYMAAAAIITIIAVAAVVFVLRRQKRAPAN